jgi:hypothetical protein
MNISEFLEVKGIVLSSKKGCYFLDGTPISWPGLSQLYAQETTTSREEKAQFYSDKEFFCEVIKNKVQKILPLKEVLQLEILKGNIRYLNEKDAVPVVDKNSGRTCFISLKTEELIPFCVKSFLKQSKMTKEQFISVLTIIDIRHDKNLTQGIHNTFFNWVGYEHLIFDNNII